MKEEVNIAELLKDAPKGTKLYSPAFGEVKFDKVYDGIINCLYEVYRENDEDFCAGTATAQFLMNGKLNNVRNSECMLFPSSIRRTWKDFKGSWRHKRFEPLQKVLISYFYTKDMKMKWRLDFYSHYDYDAEEHILASGQRVKDDEIIPYDEEKIGADIYVK